MDVIHAARTLDLPEMRVKDMCRKGAFPNAVKDGNKWVIPDDEVQSLVGKVTAARERVARGEAKRIVTSPYEVRPVKQQQPDDQYAPEGNGYVIFVPFAMLRDVNEYLNSKGIVTQSYNKWSKRRAWAWQQAHRLYAEQGRPFDPTGFFAAAGDKTPEQWFSTDNVNGVLALGADVDEVEEALNDAVTVD